MLTEVVPGPMSGCPKGSARLSSGVAAGVVSVTAMERGSGSMSRFLTMPEASAHCGGVPSSETFYKLARAGRLPVRRIGRRLVISDRLLDEWIDSVGDVWSAQFPGTALKQRSVDAVG